MTEKSFLRVGVIGAGTMGSGIASTLAENGHSVIIKEMDEDSVKNGLKRIESLFEKALKRGRITEAEKTLNLSRIDGVVEWEELASCDLVIEAAVEKMAEKKKIFAMLDQAVNKDAVLATNTSSLSITEVANATQRPDKVIGMHFFNPVPVMKLVEVIRGLHTSDETFSVVRQMAESLGKVSVTVEEAPGFVVNRILVPMINEAIGILADGVASAKDIDSAMKLGANHPIGPLALADLIGLDVCLAIMEVLQEESGDSKYRPHPLLRKMVRGGMLGRKTQQGFFSYS